MTIELDRYVSYFYYYPSLEELGVKKHKFGCIIVNCAILFE